MNKFFSHLHIFMLLLFSLTFFSGSVLSQNKKEFVNPILAGFYPDPSICKVGSDYYLVNSTFSYYPGIPVFHSKDLVNWKLIGHVLDRPEQLNLDGLGVSRGIFAPAIRYYKGVFYVTCTVVDGGGNFVVTSKKPEGPWSNPVWLPQVNGIDPSLFFDTENLDSAGAKAYILYNSDAPENKPLYNGHRTIRMYEFDLNNLKVVGENKILVNGGVDISKKPVWIEGPHIYKIKGTYYLMAAEGGTSEDHSEVIFKSDKVDGPYVPYEKNPILTQRNLDPKRKFPITCTGHADLVKTDNGSWWAVFLGCRPYEPYEENYYNTGRETFLAPVKWIDGPEGKGWPVINPDFKEVQYHYPLPVKSQTIKNDIPYHGNFTIKDDFAQKQLHPSWVFLRTPREKWFNLTDRKGFLKLKVRPEKISDPVSSSFLGRRQQHSKGYGSTSLIFNPLNDNEKAGLLIFQDERHFYFLCKSKESGANVVQLYKSSNDSSNNNMELVASQRLYDNSSTNKEIFLKIETKGKDYNFYYSYDNKDWKLLKENVDASFLSIKKAWGFVGNMYALYATSLGKSSDNAAYYDWFEYKGDDDVYK